MSKLLTPAEVASRLHIDSSRVRRLAERYDLGTKLNDRMRVYTEDDVVVMQRLSTGVPGRPPRLTESLDQAADGWDDLAAASIADHEPEDAVRSQRIARHLRRISGAHRSTGNDPVQST